MKVDKRIEAVTKFLESLGTVEDYTEDVAVKYRNLILKSYELYENKYNDTVDDSLCIEVWSNGTYVVTNEDLSFDCESEEDLQKLKELFVNTSFYVTINELNKVGHKATLSVKAKAKNLRKLGQLIKEYRSCNCKYLKDKVTEIIGDDGRVYLDRISERMD